MAAGVAVWHRMTGCTVRASAKFVEAYRLGQDSKAWELLPSSRLFLPDGSEQGA